MKRLRKRYGHTRSRGSVFPVGAKVYLDGQYTAKVLQAFPEGSTSHLFPHYKVRTGDERWGEDSVVSMDRVGVDKKAPRSGMTAEEALWAAEYDAKHPLGTLEEARALAERESGGR